MTLGYLLTAAGLGHMCLGALLFFNASMMQTVRLRFVSWLGFFFCVCVEKPPYLQLLFPGLGEMF